MGKIISNASLLTSAVAALLVAAPALAADTPATDETSLGPLAEIVVTATRKEESLSKVPISVTALTSEMLDVRGIKDFQDVARFTPGVQIDNTGTNNIAIRGIAYRRRRHNGHLPGRFPHSDARARVQSR
jgi:outer membrane receptor protein involved in Fe transport